MPSRTAYFSPNTMLKSPRQCSLRLPGNARDFHASWKVAAVFRLTICAQLFASCVRGCSNQDRTTRAESLPVAQQRARRTFGKRSKNRSYKESPRNSRLLQQISESQMR